MSSAATITFVDLLCYIRQQIIEAREKKDEYRLNKIMHTLSLIDDAITAQNDPTYVDIVDDMANALRNSFIAEYKVEIPSEKTIKSASADHPQSS